MANVRIEGLNDVLEMLNSISERDVVQKMQKACALVERSAKQNAPKDTGALRRSITSKVEKDNDGNIVGTVFTPLEYAPYLEYGTGLFAESQGRVDVPWHYQDDEGVWHSTSGLKPRKFMRTALNDNRDKIIRLFKESGN